MSTSDCAPLRIYVKIQLGSGSSEANAAIDFTYCMAVRSLRQLTSGTNFNHIAILHVPHKPYAMKFRVMHLAVVVSARISPVNFGLHSKRLSKTVFDWQIGPALP